MRRVVRPYLGSALRLSQPLSGFLARAQGSWPCFMPQPFLGSSLQSFSLTRIACPSRGRQLPCSYPPVCGSASSLAVHRRFPRRPRFHAVAWFPRRLWSPFPRARELVSRSSWARSGGVASFRQLHLLRSLPPLARPFQLPRVAPQRLAVSLGFLPLRSFLPPRLGFSTRPHPKARARPSSEDSGA